MILGNDKPIRIVGHPESSMTLEFESEIGQSHCYQTITPEQYWACDRKQEFQYIVASSYDLAQRQAVIESIDTLGLDLITVVHPTSIVAGTVGAGSFIFSFCDIKIKSAVGRHSIIGSYSLIGHYSTIGNNCILRPGVMVTGKSQVGNNCVFNLRSTVTNGVEIADNVELAALSGVTKNLAWPGLYAGTPARRVANTG